MIVFRAGCSNVGAPARENAEPKKIDTDVLQDAK